MSEKSNLDKMPYADFHQDTVNPRLAEILQNPEFAYAAERQKQLPKEGLKKIDIIFASIYRRAGEEVKAAALKGDEKVLAPVREDYYRIADYYNATQDFKVITKPEDLRLREGDYQINSVVLHLESGDIITNPDIVNELYERGVRSVGPIYSHDNKLGGGASGNKNRGLTALGRRVIDRMTELGIVIDIAHSNRKTAHDILERVGDYPKSAATHTALGKGQRFITPDLLRKIAAKGGVAGFTPANAFFPSLDKYIEAYQAASDITGSTKNLAIGTDLGGLDAKYLFSDFQDISKLSLIAEKLSGQGNFSDEDIAGIMYGNVEKIVKQLK